MTKSAREIAKAMPNHLIRQVACLPFTQRRFTANGQVLCGCAVCGQGPGVPPGTLAAGLGPPTRFDPCWNVELLCEMMAAIILVPKPTHDCSQSTATRLAVEPWVLRFRQAIG